VQLTKTEFALLEHLMRHPRLVLSRSQLFEAVWGYDFGPRSNSLEVYIGYPAPQDGGGRRAALDPDSARGRVLAS